MMGMAWSNLAAFAVLFRARRCGKVAAKFIQGRFGGLRAWDQCRIHGKFSLLTMIPNCAKR